MRTSKYLLDTNICVFLLRDKFMVKQRLLEIGIRKCCISEITVAELLYGAECSNDCKKNRREVVEFCSTIEVIPIAETIEEYARQKATLRKSGTLVDDFDIMIGATAKRFDMIMVTDNLKHFSRMNLQLENWVIR